jgi:hypothetical protein
MLHVGLGNPPAVHIDYAVANFDPISAHCHSALQVYVIPISRRMERDNIASLHSRKPITHAIHQDMIADQYRSFHGSRRNQRHLKRGKRDTQQHDRSDNHFPEHDVLRLRTP